MPNALAAPIVIRVARKSNPQRQKSSREIQDVPGIEGRDDDHDNPDCCDDTCFGGVEPAGQITTSRMTGISYRSAASRVAQRNHTERSAGRLNPTGPKK